MWNKRNKMFKAFHHRPASKPGSERELRDASSLSHSGPSRAEVMWDTEGHVETFQNTWGQSDSPQLSEIYNQSLLENGTKLMWSIVKLSALSHPLL